MEKEIRIQTEAPKTFGVERENQRNVAADWTKSEWFEVWLKLARRQYDPPKN